MLAHRVPLFIHMTKMMKTATNKSSDADDEAHAVLDPTHFPPKCKETKETEQKQHYQQQQDNENQNLHINIHISR